MQGFNMGRYHPPSSLDPSLANKLSGGFNRRADGKSTQGTGPPTVRFEMPFAIWCTNCEPEEIVGQGIRFNAQKTKVGNYYTTPIWAFRMKHTTCGGTIEIRTDPAAGDYIVQEGGRRRDYGEANDHKEGMFGEILTAEEREKRDADPFASLEGKVKQGLQAKTENQLVEELRTEKNRDWDDVWTANRRLRDGFRVEKKVLHEKQKNREEIADRMALHIDILDETKEDGQRAALINFGESEDIARRTVAMSASRPLFKDGSESVPRKNPLPGTKAPIKSTNSKLLLQQTLTGNTRAIVDPFLVPSSQIDNKDSSPRLAGIKRRRDPRDNRSLEIKNSMATGEGRKKPSEEARTGALVAYESDDDD
jgi:coiled-coil domain-containing protein 130